MNEKKVNKLIFLFVILSTSFILGCSTKNADYFTIVTIPDTQFYSEKNIEIFERQIEWILENKDRLNIQMVLHLGDIVEHRDNVLEWERANKTLSKLDEKIPWSVLPGNHDLRAYDNFSYLNNSSLSRDKFDNYNAYFGYERFLNYSWYKGHFPYDGNQNSYQLLDINNKIKFGFLSLKWNPDNSDLAWANKIVMDNAEYKFIVATHEYLSETGERRERGDKIWDGLIRNYDNIVMVVSGHRTNEANLTSIGKNGNKIYQVVTDYQYQPNSGNGWLRYYKFNYKGELTEESTYSPYLGYDLATAYKKKNFICVSIDECKTVVRLNPEDEEAYRRLGVAYESKGMINESIDAFKKMIELDPDYANKMQVHNHLGLLYHNLELYNLAKEEFEKALEIDPANAATIYGYLGANYGRMGKTKLAIDYYKKALEIDPNHTETLFNLGLTYGEEGLINQSIEAYKRLISIDPTYAMDPTHDLNPNYLRALNNLGISYLRMGLIDEAKIYFKEAIRIDPEFVLAQKNFENLLALEKDKGVRRYTIAY